MANLRDKNDRAIAAYISPIANGVAPINVYPSNCSGERALPEIDVITSQGLEDPPFSGLHILNVRVRIVYHAANQPDQANAQANSIALGKMADAVFDAFHVTNHPWQDYQATAQLITQAGNNLAFDQSGGTAAGIQSAADNADMADYSCIQFFGVDYAGAPEEGTDSNTFVEVINFKCRSAPAGGLGVPL